ncbi:hypothetical protein HBA53_00460 [Rhodococcus pyridinivorans]|uniref:hypothetical protein n=1 Tax=Rhodococcus pyridinivorans TaxID=103816 RepID=UPI001C30D82B|nr:hypothetical protein [Rhodococcus pyridinivorans]QXF79746.1 hypothetical protein HBA53_00460 [Rhodococcus pyridinivorans]
MTIPASPLPVAYDAPPTNPANNGLYLVATIHDIPASQPSRLSWGVDIYPINFDPGWGTTESEPCATPDEPIFSGIRAQPEDPFAPLTVWGYDECDPSESIDEQKTRALQNLRLHEQGLVESHFAAHLLAAAGTPTVMADVVTALAELEVRIGETGIQGAVIHLSQRYSTILDAAGISVGSGPLPRTRLGNLLAFGGGYDSVLGTTMVATGQVFVWRSEIFTQDVLDVDAHLRSVIAERTIVAGTEAVIAAVEVTP